VTTIWELPRNISRTHKKAIRSNALGQWSRTAWNDIAPESIIRRFKKCCVSNDICGTEVVFLQEEDHMVNRSSCDESVVDSV
jgi:hypothetical protein